MICVQHGSIVDSADDGVQAHNIQRELYGPDDHVTVLGAISRISIQRMGSPDVCSACGDPADDYRLVNAAEAMPGVPSLRLCSDCVGIRRGGGEILEPIT
ncbi:hypothetical protein K7W03_15305 [Sphingobium sp. PNB]|uniref:hypothetical protein n=1 Tax=Sphingobium sp. PNB TaxID=863934 RepID=UPI001CA3FAA2|nr:hypothetical protein [Sphingobium sp. PNB]MCB4860959.1 hypothetical protein [Sphingobium sp. PNB]